MTDHRATNLSYGHLGEASYDLYNQKWQFSRGIALESFIQPLQALQQCTPPSSRVPPSSNKIASEVRYAQIKWLQNTLPEAGPAGAILSSMTNVFSKPPIWPHPSALLAIGKAADLDQTSGTRAMQIIAMAHGEGGNVLRLIKPQIEILKWNDNDTKLRSLNAASSEDCYWLGDGGAIQQITFAADSEGLTSWLAVLKAESTTILRPKFRHDHTSSSISVDTERRYPPSRLDPSPVLRLGNERTGGRPHADVSFNPWYTQQFAIIDSDGYWSVWDIEGQKRKRTTFEAKPGRSGHVQDDSLPDPNSESHHSADGWGRVLWAGGVNTLVLCDRRNLTVFDIKAAPKRLYSPKIVHPMPTDWILDVKRSIINLHHIFVLTTSQILWLQINEVYVDQDEQCGSGGAKILLSYQHFRDPEDLTAKLELFGENEDCFVLLYSTQSLLINTYRFSPALGESAAPICSQSSFIAELGNGDHSENPADMIQTICVLPTTFILHNLKPMSGPAKEYADRDIRFYQLFGLGMTFGLYHTLCFARQTASGESEVKYRTVLAPTMKDRRTGKPKSLYLVDEDRFIIPDGLGDDDTTIESFKIPPNASHKFNYQPECPVTAQVMSAAVNARRLFEISFLGRGSEIQDGSTSPNEPQSMASYLQSIHLDLEERKKHGQQGLITFLELIGHTTFSEDIDEAAFILRDLVNSLGQNEEAADTMAVTPLAIKPTPLVMSDSATESGKAMPDLSHIYDKLVETWVSCLPRKTPGPARLAKEEIVRSTAIELCLSALAISVRDKSVVLPKPAESQEGTDFVLPVRTKPYSTNRLDANPAQISPPMPILGLPSPAITLSLPSNDNAAAVGEPIEDEAILRLRGYVLSINSQPPLGASRSAILAHWPSTPGADPSKYSWEASSRAVAEVENSDSGEEENLIHHRERDRRRRRTEKFLKRSRINTIDEASQPMPTVLFGSQPDFVQHTVSSQTADVLMTQPDRGIFGSRLGQKGFKKRRTIGF